MRVVTVVALAIAVVLATITRGCVCETNMRWLALAEDEDDFRPHHFYRDYGLIRSRVARAEDAFDDYGHLRFGRSDD